MTGFLGPNGAGKTTTLRMILGLVHPTAGTATIGGQRLPRHPDPLQRRRRRARGVELPPGPNRPQPPAHPVRGGRSCPIAGPTRCSRLVGLTDVGRRKVRGYSMGMRQRLGLAATLLGDPKVLILDEPANGLDPDGIRWLRSFFRYLAGEGRTVLVSSHQLNEVQEVADRVIILDRGRLVRAGSIAELTAGSDSVVVRTPQPRRPRQALAQAGIGGQYEPPANGLAPAVRVAHRRSGPRRATSRSRPGSSCTNCAWTASTSSSCSSPSRRASSRPRRRVSRSAAPSAVPSRRRLASRAATGPAAAPGPGQRRERIMTGLIRAELRKVRSTQVWFWLLLASSRSPRCVVGRSPAPAATPSSCSDQSTTSWPRRTRPTSRSSSSACSR